MVGLCVCMWRGWCGTLHAHATGRGIGLAKTCKRNGELGCHNMGRHGANGGYRREDAREKCGK